MKYEDEKMLIPGLVSVTFRSLSQNEIANLMCRSELKAIEWGGDVHIPVKDNPTEEDMEKLDEALSNASYLSESGKFYIASLGTKKMIACQLFSRVEVGKGYKVKIVMNMTYRQFVDAFGGEEKEKLHIFP